MIPRRPIRRTRRSGAGQYRRGAAFEHALIADLEKRGYWCVRSAGSRGAADVVALARGHQALVVQAKRGGRISDAERLKLVEVTVKTGAHGLLASGARDGWTYEDVWTGEAWNGVALPVAGEA